MTDLRAVETELHEEARDHERRGEYGVGSLLRAAGDLVAEARRIDSHPDLIARTDCPSGGVPRRV